MIKCCEKCSHRCPDCYDNIHCINPSCECHIKLCHTPQIKDGWEEKFEEFGKKIRMFDYEAIKDFTRSLLATQATSIVAELKKRLKHIVMYDNGKLPKYGVADVLNELALIKDKYLHNN